MECEICRSQTEKIFEKTILQKYKSSYYKCNSCLFVKTDEPVWLEEAYKSDVIELPMHILREGEYIISAGAAIPKVEVLDQYIHETFFNILDSISPVAKTTEGRDGAVLPVLEWKKV